MKQKDWFDKDVTIDVTMEMADKAIANVTDVVNKYRPGMLHKGTGLFRIFNEDVGRYWKAKGWLVDAMRKHPCYNGNGQIVLHHVPMNRYINKDKIKAFKHYIESYTVQRFLMNNNPGLDYISYSRIKYAICIVADFVLDNDTNIIDAETADRVNTNLSFVNIQVGNGKDIAKKGMKVTRIIQQIAMRYGLDKHVNIEDIGHYNADDEWVEKQKDMGWNYQSKAFADAVTEIHKFGTLIFSVNPVDYLTSSIGKDWSSCHSVDKDNIRKKTNNYSGMYMAGNISYMIDPSSIVVYFLPDDYQGNAPELEEKLKRCMFYIGKDKIIMSRVYPDGRDAYDGRNGNQKSLSADIRRAVLNIIIEIFDIPEYVPTETIYGTLECSDVIDDEDGANYPDYNHYDDCNVTYIGYDKNYETILVGERPICFECGETYRSESDLFCKKCRI